MKKIIKNLFFILSFVSIVLVSCKEDKELDPELSVSPTTSSIIFAADGKSATSGGIDITASPVFIVTTNQGSWDVVSDQSWLHVQKSTNSFKISVDANTGLDARNTAKVTVTAGNAQPVFITVTQMGENPYLSVVPELTSIVFAADGESASSDDESITPTFKVSTNVSSWDVASDQSWLHLNKLDDTFTLSADVNTSLYAPDPATVTVTAGEATPIFFTITQMPSPAILKISSSDDVMFSADGKSAISNGATFVPVFTVTTNYPTWDATSDQSWLNVEKAENTFTLIADANLFVGAPSATVTVTAGDMASISINVTQEGNPNGAPTYAISTETWEIESDDKTIKQEWSDYIEYDGGNKVLSGTISTFNGDYRDAAPGYRGYLYSWHYVTDHSDKLCPSPWRVPTKDDLINLDKALGGTGENVVNNLDLQAKYNEKWKLSFGGHVKADGSLKYQGAYHYIWTTTSFDVEKAFYQLITQTGNISPQANTSSTGKTGGRPVRCIRDLKY